jgi:hypothetical protein
LLPRYQVKFWETYEKFADVSNRDMDVATHHDSLVAIPRYQAKFWDAYKTLFRVSDDDVRVGTQGHNPHPRSSTLPRYQAKFWDEVMAGRGAKKLERVANYIRAQETTMQKAGPRSGLPGFD